MGPPIPFRADLLIEDGNLLTGDPRIGTGLNRDGDGGSDALDESSHSSSHAVMRVTRARAGRQETAARMEEDTSSESSADLLGM